MALIDRDMLHEQPYEALATLRRLNDRVVGAIMLEASADIVLFDVVVDPPLELAPHGWPREQVRIADRARDEHPIAIPLRPAASWKHRNPIVEGHPLSGSLCLWYPRDPPHLRWTWELGLEQFITLVHRHLILEQAVRNGCTWSSIMEDTPHGEPPDGRPYPIRYARTGR